jgi:conjugal transfer/entry exclusion protein
MAPYNFLIKTQNINSVINALATNQVVVVNSTSNTIAVHDHDVQKAKEVMNRLGVKYEDTESKIAARYESILKELSDKRGPR